MSGHVELIGEVVEVNKDKFTIQIVNDKKQKTEAYVSAQLSGKMRMNKIRVLLGDWVKVKVSPYDTSHGFIVSRE